ncbi:sensor histidine kinase [Nocardioides campestrisoli]|uniref:sensor histidine kinase n=1 Tax=Nocardioides campestrisoli TaxID=2736757 RepID=UPI00163DA656|nr:sensor histidine kinase [Nocardioides campestrisoli]
MSTPQAPPPVPDAWEPRDHWQRLLPLLLLGLGAAGATFVHGSLDTTWVSLPVALAVAAATAAWIALFTFVVPPTPRRLQVMYVVRTALAFLLASFNPLFAIFAFVGYLDVFDLFRRRAAFAGVAATALTNAGAQAGGFPPRGAEQGAIFVILVAVNLGLALFFTLLHRRMEEVSAERATTNTELAQVNQELARTLASNHALQEQVVAQARAAGVQEERQRLALEIHDTLAQSLAGVVAQLQASQDEPDAAVRRERVERATVLARGALAEARRSVLDLGPGALVQTSLPDALAALVTEWGAQQQTKADLVITGEARPLHEEVQATVVRVTQEALANVAAHARADRVGVTLTHAEDEVILDVRDDGVGFRPDEVGPGFGLRGMRQRAERLAGVLDLESEPGRGTAISVRLPALEPGAS